MTEVSKTFGLYHQLSVAALLLGNLTPAFTSQPGSLKSSELFADSEVLSCRQLSSRVRPVLCGLVCRTCAGGTVCKTEELVPVVALLFPV